jgi:hypothetical protein
MVAGLAERVVLGGRHLLDLLYLLLLCEVLVLPLVCKRAVQPVLVLLQLVFNGLQRHRQVDPSRLNSMLSANYKSDPGR